MTYSLQLTVNYNLILCYRDIISLVTEAGVTYTVDSTVFTDAAGNVEQQVFPASFNVTVSSMHIVSKKNVLIQQSKITFVP